MLGVGGASAVSDQKHFISGTERIDDRESNIAYDREQRRVIGCALEGCRAIAENGLRSGSGSRRTFVTVMARAFSLLIESEVKL